LPGTDLEKAEILLDSIDGNLDNFSSNNHLLAATIKTNISTGAVFVA